MIKKRVVLVSVSILILSLFFLIFFYNTERGITGNTITGGVINPPGFFLEENGLVVIETEHYDNQINRSGYSWNFETINSEYSADGYIKVLPVGDIIFYADAVSYSPELDYIINFTNSGTYFVWVRGQARDSNSNSFHMGLNGVLQLKTTTINWFFNFSSWEWSNKSEGGLSQINIPSPGVYTINVWMRETGFSLDKIVFTSNLTFIPQGLGPAETNRVIFTPISCTENWTCGNWTSCINNTQNRTCTDLNNCGTNITKLSEINNNCNLITPSNFKLPGEPNASSMAGSISSLTTKFLSISVALFAISERVLNSSFARSSSVSPFPIFPVFTVTSISFLGQGLFNAPPTTSVSTL